MVKESDNNFGLASLIFGITSLVSSLTILFGFVAGIVFGLVGLIFGIIQNKRGKNKWSTWGIILSVLGIIIGILVLIWFASAIITFSQQLQQNGLINQGNIYGQ